MSDICFGVKRIATESVNSWSLCGLPAFYEVEYRMSPVNTTIAFDYAHKLSGARTTRSQSPLALWLGARARLSFKHLRIASLEIIDTQAQCKGDQDGSGRSDQPEGVDRTRVHTKSCLSSIYIQRCRVSTEV